MTVVEQGLLMFTGIVTDIGEIAALTPTAQGQLHRLRIACRYDRSTIADGASIACNGVCLTVVASGFKTYNRKGFHLSAQQTLREDVTLAVGTAAEAITVTAEASLLKTESSEMVHNVTLSQLNELPVLPIGTTGAGYGGHSVGGAERWRGAGNGRSVGSHHPAAHPV